MNARSAVRGSQRVGT